VCGGGVVGICFNGGAVLVSVVPCLTSCWSGLSGGVLVGIGDAAVISVGCGLACVGIVGRGFEGDCTVVDRAVFSKVFGGVTALGAF